MTRLLRVSLITVAALAMVLVISPAPAAAAGRFGIYHGWYGGWGWGPAWGWGPGWYGRWWGPGYYYAPNTGNVKIVTPDKGAMVYVDGGYAGVAAKMKKFPLRAGTHELALREPGGRTIYDQRIEVLRGKTTEIYAGEKG